MAKFTADLIGQITLSELLKRIKCFVAGTQVVVASRSDGDGIPHYQTRNIEEIKPGDWVLARDEFGTNIQRRQVTHTFKRAAFSLVVLNFVDESGGTQTLITTEEHPFWVENHHEFRPANWLKPGDTFTSPDGQLQTLTSASLDAHPEGIFVYNFSVDVAHTYFVAASSETLPLLVHNAGYEDAKNAGKLDYDPATQS